MDLVGLATAFWKFKMWILAGTVLAGIIAVYLAMTARPVYQAKAVIAQKESDKSGGNANVLSKLGGLGGLMGGQLGGGNTTLDRIEVILRGHELADSVITKNNLMPKLFPDLWDASAGAWKVKDPSKIPDLRKGIDLLSNQILGVAVDTRKNMITVSASIYDSLLVKQIVDFYLDALNEKLFMDVKKDAETNRDYLESQLANVSDPMIREKISNMIGFEIEKYMLVSSKSIEVLDRPVVPLERSAPLRKKMVAMGLLIGFFLSTFAVFALLFVQRSLAEQKSKRSALA
jgi:capsular polysaccharide biosynthesis protein